MLLLLVENGINGINYLIRYTFLSFLFTEYQSSRESVVFNDCRCYCQLFCVLATGSDTSKRDCVYMRLRHCLRYGKWEKIGDHLSPKQDKHCKNDRTPDASVPTLFLKLGMKMFLHIHN